jgi:V/A-type H+/Na+-transporting ATPase subunit E
MTGLEKIVNKIEHNSAQKCENLIAEARKQAEEIIAQAGIDAEKILLEATEKSMIRAEELIAMAHSGAKQKAMQIILTARNQAINDTLDCAVKAMKEMPADEYFSALKALAVKNAGPGAGEMLLSGADLKRLPYQFEAQINNELGSKGSSLKINSKPAGISDGFVLVYGDIEINCTFDALLDAYREELKEKIIEIIF